MTVFKISVEALSPLLVGGREKLRSVHTSNSVKEIDGKRIPVIPASAFKGALREFISRWRKVLKIDESVLREMFGEEGDGRENAGKVIFSDLELAHPLEDFWTYRTRIKIDPMTRTVVPHNLVEIAAVKEGSIFEGVVVFMDDEISKIFKDKLEGKTFRIGAMKSSGFGEIRIKKMKKIDKQIRKLTPGIYEIYLKPLTGFTTTPKGRGFGKSYILRSETYISGTAIRGFLEKFGIEPRYVTHAYPVNDTGSLSVPNPRFMMSYKYEGGSINVLSDLARLRKERVAFSMRSNGKRLDKAKGYYMIKDLSKVAFSKYYSAHVRIDHTTGSHEEGVLFVQEYVQPKMLGLFMNVEDSVEIPMYFALGGSRSRGFGLFELVEARKIDPDHIRRSWMKRAEKFSEVIGHNLVPVVLRTHLHSSLEVFKADVFDSIGDLEDFRLFDPDESAVRIFRSIAPGSVAIFKVDSIRSFVDFLVDMKIKGIGNLTELGFGDFEVIPF